MLIKNKVKRWYLPPALTKAIKAIQAERLHKKTAIVSKRLLVKPLQSSASLAIFSCYKMIFAICISLSYLFEMVTKRNQFCHVHVPRIGDLL